ncbi:MAG: DUF4198 domain-containing protein [Ignavibacteriales bacterium]|nr:DUF4198 domain-containing protein [Ignavibacteriales bacterium]
MKLLQMSVLTIFMTSSLLGHDFFLFPSPFSINEKGKVKIAIHVDDVFPGNAVKWSASRVLRFEHRFGSSMADLRKKEPEKDSSGVIVSIEGLGLNMFALDWAARLIELKPDQFSHYLESEGLDHILKMRKERGEENKNGRERYSRFVKTLVHNGLGNSEALSKVVGQHIELVPLENPYVKQVGDSLRVQLLFQGKPQSNALISSTYAGATKKADTYAQSARTNEQGIVYIRLTHGGPWLVRTVHMLPVANDKDADWESWWASVTFEVQQK